MQDQLPLRRLIRNLKQGHVFGLFHARSHLTEIGTTKVAYKSKVSAQKAASAMMRKKGVYFSTYKCMRCDGFHLGKNRDNKVLQDPLA